MIKELIYKFIYKPNSREIYWGKIIPSVVVVLGFSVVVHYTNIRVGNQEKERNTFKRYTIGTTITDHNNIKGGMVVDYEYFFARSKYKKYTSTNNWLFNKPITHGGRYYVQFAYINPDNSDMLFNCPVPDSITNSPDSGWEYMPGYEKERN